MPCKNYNNRLKNFSQELLARTSRHPCFSVGACHIYARMHLPVAPDCNIACNYCNRRFDCLHESRPGVTSQVLSPEEALEKFLQVREKITNLSVVGIAGPGDALANWEETRRSIQLIKEVSPDIIFCLSTNGLMLPELAPELMALGVTHVTVTVNTVDPEIGAKIYRSVTYRGEKYKGKEGAELLIGNQLTGISCLAEGGVVVKVNIVMIKGINDFHVPVVVKKVGELGAFIVNIMPLIPAPGSVFAHYPQPSMKEVNRMRDLCAGEILQMRHCQQCRADAVGLLTNDVSRDFYSSSEKEIEQKETSQGQELYTIAVATKYGNMVDMHFGHAEVFAIYRGDGLSFQLVEKRYVSKYCAAPADCDGEFAKEEVAEFFKDCDAVLSMRIGYHAKKRLAQKGVFSVEYCDTVERGLAYAVQKIREERKKKQEAV